MKKILLVSGGTGGHFFPAVAAGHALKDSDYQVFMITDNRCKKYIKSSDPIKYKIIDLYIKTGSIIQKLHSGFKLLISIIRSYFYLKRLKPDLVIGFGGYPSFPAVYASKLLSIPFLLHEQNNFLGKVNRYFAHDAEAVMCSFNGDISSDKSIKLEFIGDIVRPEIKKISIENSFDSNPLRITIFGGSAGAKIFSEIIPAAITLAKEKSLAKKFNCKIIQQLKQEDHKKVSAIYDSMGVEYELKEFFHDMERVYTSTDIAIARSGASSIAELSALRIPAIFIPYPYAAEAHQLENARIIAKMGGGWYFEEKLQDGESNKDDLINSIASKLVEINENRDLLKIASKNLQNRKTDGDQALVATVKRILC